VLVVDEVPFVPVLGFVPIVVFAPAPVVLSVAVVPVVDVELVPVVDVAPVSVDRLAVLVAGAVPTVAPVSVGAALDSVTAVVVVLELSVVVVSLCLHAQRSRANAAAVINFISLPPAYRGQHEPCLPGRHGRQRWLA
jgi:hypothetical protein